MKFYYFLLWKAYFDKGFALTNYFKYALAFFGIFNLVSAKIAIVAIIIYLFSCLIIGWIWFKLGLTETENEIQNLFNPFQREVREVLRKRKAFK